MKNLTIALALAAFILPAPGRAAETSGAGSTFVYPVLSKWAAEYEAKTGNKISWVVLEENALPPAQARLIVRRRDRIEERSRRLIVEGIEDGSIGPCDPKLAMFALFGAINWVPKWYREDGEWSAAHVADSMVDMITRNLVA